MIKAGKVGEESFLPPVSAGKYRVWVPIVDKVAFRERVKYYCRADEWDESAFERMFFSFFYARASISKEEYDSFAQQIANSMLLPF